MSSLMQFGFYVTTYCVFVSMQRVFNIEEATLKKTTN